MVNILWEDIRDWITFASDICVLLITIYTFYKTFICSKIEVVSFINDYSMNGESHDITFLNKKMVPMAITEVQLIIEDKYLFTFANPRNPIIIEGFSTCSISTGEFGYIDHELSIFSENVIVEVTLLHNKKIYLGGIKRYLYMLFRKRVFNLERASKVTYKFNNKIIPRYAKYILIIKEKDVKEDTTVFIFESGVMTEVIAGYNGIPKEVVGNIESLSDFLHEWLDIYEIKFILKEIQVESSCNEEEKNNAVNEKDNLDLPEAYNFVISGREKIKD